MYLFAICYANMTNMIRRQIIVLPFEMEMRLIISTEPGFKKASISFIHILSLLLPLYDPSLLSICFQPVFHPSISRSSSSLQRIIQK